jgi:hypothetical protein
MALCWVVVALVCSTVVCASAGVLPANANRPVNRAESNSESENCLMSTDRFIRHFPSFILMHLFMHFYRLTVKNVNDIVFSSFAEKSLSTLIGSGQYRSVAQHQAGRVAVLAQSRTASDTKR